MMERSAQPFDRYKIFEPFSRTDARTTTRYFQVNDNDRDDVMASLNLPRDQMAVPLQIHGSHVQWVSSGGDYPDCDGVLTFKKDLVLSVVIADCIPVFLYASDIQAIGVVHSGWRGAANGIVTEAVRLLTEKSAEPHHIYAALGASISQEFYEVKEDVASLFPAYISKRNKCLFLDVSAVVKNQLLTLDIPKKNIEVSPYCTWRNNDRYYSWRKNKTEQRMISTIMMRR